jgi:hypothetical protein
VSAFRARRVLTALLPLLAATALAGPAQAQSCPPPACIAPAAPVDGRAPQSGSPGLPPLGPETIPVVVDQPPVPRPPAPRPWRPASGVTGFALAASLTGTAAVAGVLRAQSRRRPTGRRGANATDRVPLPQLAGVPRTTDIEEATP